MRDNITGKSILLIADPFYGYWKLIREQLLQLGAKSVYYKEVDFNIWSLRDNFNLHRFSRWLLNPWKRTKWTNDFVREIENMKFDTLFVIENMSFKKTFLDELRKRNPNVRMILFLWDTFKTQQPRYMDYLHKFDSVYSFDRDDASKYGLRYFPDFYIDSKTMPIDQCKYDIAFVGTMNLGPTRFRGELLKKICLICRNLDLKFFFYLRCHGLATSNNKFRRFYQRIRNYSYLRQVKNLTKLGIAYSHSLPIEDYNQVMGNTQVVLDLNYQDRQGLTINAITALANGRKLITTNKRIAEEPFYDSSMIYIIDDVKPTIDPDFFGKPYRPVDVSYLRLDNWLRHVVNESS